MTKTIEGKNGTYTVSRLADMITVTAEDGTETTFSEAEVTDYAGTLEDFIEINVEKARQRPTIGGILSKPHLPPKWTCSINGINFHVKEPEEYAEETVLTIELGGHSVDFHGSSLQMLARLTEVATQPQVPEIHPAALRKMRKLGVTPLPPGTGFEVGSMRGLKKNPPKPI